MVDRQVKTGAVISYLTVALNLVLGLLYTPWMLEKLGDSGYGVYSIATSVLSFILVDIGVNFAVSRYTAKFALTKDRKSTEDMLSAAVRVNTVCVLIMTALFAIYWFCIDFIYTGFTPDEISSLKSVYIVVASTNLIIYLLSPVNAVLTGTNRFIFYKLCDLAARVLTITGAIFTLVYGMGLLWFAAANYCFIIIVSLAKIVYVRKAFGFRLSLFIPHKAYTRLILGMSLWLTVTTVCQRLSLSLMPTFLGMWWDSSQTAYFALAARIEGIIFTVSCALNGLFIPGVTLIVESSQSEDELRKRLADTFTRVGKFQLTVLGAVILGFAVMGKGFIPLWIKDESYLVSYPVTVLITLPMLYTMTQDIASTALVVTGKLRRRAVAYALSLVVSVAFALILVPKYGALGAGISYFLGEVSCKCVLMTFVYKKDLGIPVWTAIKNCYLRMLPPLAVYTAFLMLLERFVPSSGIVVFALKVLAAAVVYLCSVWFLGYTREDKDFVRKLAKRI